MINFFSYFITCKEDSTIDDVIGNEIILNHFKLFLQFNPTNNYLSYLVQYVSTPFPPLCKTLEVQVIGKNYSPLDTN